MSAVDDITKEKGGGAVSPDEFSSRFVEFVVPISRFVGRRADRGDVDDIVADVFSIAWRKHGSVTPGEELPWLYRIASNVIANHRRKSARHIRLVSTLTVRDAAPSAESIAVADISLAAAWAEISPTYREVLALTAIEGLSVTEVATVLGITPNAVSVRLNRARAQLSAELAAQS